MRAERGQPLLCCHAKGLFSGSACEPSGGARPAGRRCEVSVAFERENPESLGLPAQDSKTDRRSAGFSPPRVQLSSHSCGLKLSRACSFRRAAYAYPQRGPKAQHSTGEGNPAASARARRRAPAQRLRRGARDQERRLVKITDASTRDDGLLPEQKRQRRAARATGTAIGVRSVTSGGRAGRLTRSPLRRRVKTKGRHWRLSLIHI